MISVEWSFNQNCFHVEPLKDAVKSNLYCLLTGGYTDYVIVGVFNSYKEADDFIQNMRDKGEIAASSIRGRS